MNVQIEIGIRLFILLLFATAWAGIVYLAGRK
jgi:hypothetical protein